MVSMDEMTDLIELGKEYGEIELGDRPPQKLSEKYGKFSQFQPNPINRNWFNMAKFINYGPSKMQTFINIISKATEELDNDLEAERSNHFLKYMVAKRKKNIMDEYDAMIGLDSTQTLDTHKSRQKAASKACPQSETLQEVKSII